MLLQSEEEANVAGDDAHYCELSGYEDVADRVIAANGLLEPTKTFRSDQIGAVCLKRGLVQIEERCFPKVMLVFPSFSNIGEFFGYHAPQFTYPNMPRTKLISKVGAELYRFLRALYVSGIETHLDEVYDLLKAIYESARFPKHGSLPPYGDTLIPVLPDAAIGLSQISPLEFLLRNHFSSGVVAPKIIRPEDSDPSEDSILISGGCWSSRSTRGLRYLEVLEYVVKEEQQEVLWGMEAYERLVDVFNSNGAKMYTFSCIRDVPVFLQDVLSYEYTLSH
jgi:hypothetical protein